ncbi:MAG: hypothetical protein VYB54_00690 [Pseudomonadota bacterium]|nr:hypothetical protein [Pseudomonadota bacterium]
MNPVSAWRARGIARDIARHAALLERATDPAARAGLQLDRLNASWAGSLRRSGFARAMRARFDLPDRFDSWVNFDRTVPVFGKAELRDAIAAAGAVPVDGLVWRATGGTTAEPFRFPVFADEAAATTAPMWHARRGLGIEPDSRLFLVWGHSHLLGTGWKGRMRGLRRTLADRALGYHRFSAYDLEPAAMERAAQSLLAFRPAWVLGYSFALDRLARIAEPRAADFARLELRAVVATAEALPFADSRDIIERVFGAPLVMEYGAVETGPIAYEDRAGGYRPFWTHFRLECEADPDSGRHALLVTCLFERALPLLRYRIGDLVEPRADGSPLSEGFAAIRGRGNDAVRLAGGVTIHSEAISHAVRDMPGIRAYQVVVNAGSGAGTLDYESDVPLSDDVVETVRNRLCRIHPELGRMPLRRVEAVRVTAAGKRPMVVEV